MSQNTEEQQSDTSSEKKDKQVFSEREEYNQKIEGTPLFIRKKSVETEGWSVTFGNRIIYNGESGVECRSWIKNNTLIIACTMMEVVFEELWKIKTAN